MLASEPTQRAAGGELEVEAHVVEARAERTRDEIGRGLDELGLVFLEGAEDSTGGRAVDGLWVGGRQGWMCVSIGGFCCC